MIDLAREIISTQPILTLFLAIGLGYLVNKSSQHDVPVKYSEESNSATVGVSRGGTSASTASSRGAPYFSRYLNLAASLPGRCASDISTLGPLSRTQPPCGIGLAHLIILTTLRYRTLITTRFR